MMTLLKSFGLHIDQQSLSNLWAKGLGLASLVAGGFLNPAQILHDGFGVVISEALNGRIKWWAVAIGAVVTYVTSQNTDTVRTPSANTMRMAFVAFLGAGLMLSGCKSLTPIQSVTLGETIAVRSVKAAVDAEQAAYDRTPHPFSQAQHDKDLAAFKKVIAAEKALNDALLTWHATQGQSAPAAVVTAISALSEVLVDLQPLVVVNPEIAPVATSLADAISRLSKGAQ